jgi:hypothetical protein
MKLLVFTAAIFVGFAIGMHNCGSARSVRPARTSPNLEF